MHYHSKPAIPAIITLGAVQILSWGGSFYLMAVMAAPIIAETGWSQQWVYGALSLGILVSGLLAPLSGRLIARGYGPLILAGGGVVMASGLVVMGMSYQPGWFFAAWLLIGTGMAMSLYDALFATLGTLYGGQARSAITGVTLISGLCTTLVWPGTAWLIALAGWRDACFIIAALLTLLVFPAYRYALPAPVTQTGSRGGRTGAISDTLQSALSPRLFWLLCAIFTLASVIMTAISVQLITLLQSGGYSLSAALALSAVLGPCQIGSRLLDVMFKRSHPIWTALFSVGLVAAGLLLLALFPAMALIAMVLYGAGNGLRAIVRGTLPLAVVRPEQYAVITGRMARPALIGQALTPLAGGWLAAHAGADVTLWVLCGLAGINVVLVALLKQQLPAQASSVQN